MNSTESKETREQTVQNNTATLLRRVFMFLEDGDWQRADEYCEKVLDLDPENAEAYLGKLMAELHVRTREALKDQPEPFDTLSNYQKVLRFGDEKLKQQLAADAAFIKDRYETAREEARIAKEKAAKKSKKIIAILMSIVFICVASVIVLTKVIIPTQKYNAAIDLYKAGKYEDAIAAFTAMDGYRDSTVQIEKCKTAIKDEKYTAAVELYTAGKYEEAIAAFTAMDGYKDSADQIEKCKTAIKDEEYGAAVELYTAGKYEDAIAAFTAMNGYRDSVAQIEKCKMAIKDEKYAAAVELYTAGKYEEAIAAFTAMDGYKDSAAQIEKCETAIKDEKYAAAVELYTAGKYEDAIAAFTALDGYKDSTEHLNKSIVQFKKEVFKQAKEGGIVLSFGKHRWKVLKKADDKVLIICVGSVKTMAFDSPSTWKDSDIRKWLNDSFLNSEFDENEQQLILTTTNNTFIYDVNWVGDSTPPYSYGNKKSVSTSDKVFLLSREEVREYLPNENNRTDICSLDWWLRTTYNVTWADFDWYVFVNKTGSLTSESIHHPSSKYYKKIEKNVVPALWVQFDG